MPTMPIYADIDDADKVTRIQRTFADQQKANLMFNGLGAVIPTLPITAPLYEEPEETQFSGMGAIMPTMPIYADIDDDADVTRIQRTFADQQRANLKFNGLGDQSVF